MAQKRMFDKAIIETDAFLNISMSAKALYFLLGMEADDEGFVSPTRVLRLYGGEIGDIKNLVDVGLVVRFQSGVLVITDWKQNNWLDERRLKPTRYQEEKKMLTLTDEKRYVLSTCLAPAKPEEYRGEEKRGEEKRVEHRQTVFFDRFWESYPKKEKKKDSKEIWKRKELDNLADVILDFVEKAKQTDRWKRGYIKQPTAFLNGECWTDDLSAYDPLPQAGAGETRVYG